MTKYEKLAIDLENAIRCGEEAEKAYLEKNNGFDGGTCNFDACGIKLPRWIAEKVDAAAREAGTRSYVWDWCGIKRFVFNPVTHCQGTGRSVNAEAMTSYMKMAGYDVVDYCLMD